MMSHSDIGYICLSSIVSVFIHEVGHACSCCCKAISRNAALRIYCAGIWHNAAFCEICSLLMFILPVILEPFNPYGGSPTVLNVSPKSPLAGYLVPNDLIISLDDTRIHTVQERKETIALLNMQMLMSFGNSSDFKSSLATRC